MAGITWTKKFSSADDRSLLFGSQLGTVQDDVAAAFLGAGSFVTTDVTVKTASYSAVSADAGKYIVMNGTTGITLTLPDISGDEVFMIKNVGLGNLVLACDGSDTLESATGIAVNQGLILVGDGSANVWRIMANTSDDSDVDLTTGVTGVLPIANGGTGQSSTSNAINALLPAQGSANGKYLTSNGSACSWGSITTPALRYVSTTTFSNEQTKTITGLTPATKNYLIVFSLADYELNNPMQARFGFLDSSGNAVAASWGIYIIGATAVAGAGEASLMGTSYMDTAYSVQGTLRFGAGIAKYQPTYVVYAQYDCTVVQAESSQNKAYLLHGAGVSSTDASAIDRIYFYTGNGSNGTIVLYEYATS
jgi:hypothetical protein